VATGGVIVAERRVFMQATDKLQGLVLQSRDSSHALPVVERCQLQGILFQIVIAQVAALAGQAHPHGNLAQGMFCRSAARHLASSCEEPVVSPFSIAAAC